MSTPLRMFRVMPRGTLVGGFGDPEAAFPAAEGVELHEAVRSRNGPRKAQGAAATWACGVEHGVIGGGLPRCCAHHRDTPSAAVAATHRGRGAIALPWVGHGIDRRSLLFVPVPFRSELSPDHLRNEVMLVAQKLHHFRGGGDAVVTELGGIAPLADITNPVRPTTSSPAENKCLAFAIARALLACFKRQIEIQTCV